MASGVALLAGASPLLVHCPNYGLRRSVSVRLRQSSWLSQIERRKCLVITSRASSSPSAQQGNNDEAPKPKRRLRKMFNLLAQRPVPRQPNYLLWTSGIVFAIIMRKVILQELQRWPGLFVEAWEFLKELSMFVFKLLSQYAQEPTVWTLTLLGWAGLFLLDVYTFIVEYMPVREMLNTIALCTAVMSVGEAVRVNAAAKQPWILGFAAVAGLGAVFGIWNFTILSGMLAFLSIMSYVRNRDLVTALLPAATTLVAVGVPRIQAGSFLVYFIIALYRNWSAPEARDKVEAAKWTSPPIFVVFAMAIGINVAVSWLHARHLVWLAT